MAFCTSAQQTLESNLTCSIELEELEEDEEFWSPKDAGVNRVSDHKTSLFMP